MTRVAGCETGTWLEKHCETAACDRRNSSHERIPDAGPLRSASSKQLHWLIPCDPLLPQRAPPPMERRTCCSRVAKVAVAEALAQAPDDRGAFLDQSGGSQQSLAFRTAARYVRPSWAEDTRTVQSSVASLPTWGGRSDTGDLADLDPDAFLADLHAFGSEADWSRRAMHRQAGVDAVKRSCDYRLANEVLARVAARGGAEASAAAEAARPRTPDPHGRVLRKRPWERSVQNWRFALRAFSVEFADDEAKDGEQEARADAVA